MKKFCFYLFFAAMVATARADDTPLTPWATAPDNFIILGVDEFGRLYGGPGYYGSFWGRVDINDNGWLRSSDGHAWRIINGRFYNQ
jgi:hypothetical protein